MKASLIFVIVSCLMRKCKSKNFRVQVNDPEDAEQDTERQVHDL